jgi:predicted nucleic acid-binding protein
VIVVDTNVVVKLVFRAADSEEVASLFAFDPTWVAPQLVRSEVLSLLAQQGKSAGFSLRQAAEACAVALEAFEDSTLEPEPQRVLHLAARSGRSSYDCEFVAVAEELGCRLATFDRQVIRSFPTVAALPRDLLGER